MSGSPERDLDQVRRDWTVLGERDPLWAVLVDPATKGGRWEPAQFLAAGEREVASSLELVASAGLPTTGGRALDFGCGAGRLTQALAGRYGEAVGVDVSPTMLQAAAQLDTAGRCTFVANDTTDLSQFADGGFDLALSSLVLQHVPPALAEGYLAELVRVVRPGGAVVVLVATRPVPGVRGWLSTHAPLALLRAGQRLVLRYPAPMRMHTTDEATVRRAAARHGGRVVAVREETEHSPDWAFARYVLTRDGNGGPTGGT